MSKVVKLPTLVAWAPTPEDLAPGWGDLALRLSAILVHPQQEITRDLYLMFLGERIQRLVNACQDPRQAVRDLVEDLFEAGLLPDVGHVPTQRAGAYLVSSNPGTEYRLSQWGVLPNASLLPWEMPEAREVLNDERYDPESNLRSWAGLLRYAPNWTGLVEARVSAAKQ
ncbi:MAG: hypothetical protein JWO52_2552 [Gammaproteobacteria bacterium]|nr:hypothetical protein [Gammaproteobacteria bacterium]